MRKTVVNIIGGSSTVETMFLNKGYEVISSDGAECDLVCFTGGEDITPFLYGEEPLKIGDRVVTTFNPKRDMREIKAFHTYSDIPKVGICRGAQFLNVMSGGTLWQHVTHHTNSHMMEHIIETIVHPETKEKSYVTDRVFVSSTHHQQMRPGEYAEIIGYAGIATEKYTEAKKVVFPDPSKTMLDPEVVFYWYTMSLCWQPHPEYMGEKTECQRLFFQHLNDYLARGPEMK